MIGGKRYPNALPARLVRAVEDAGSNGLTVDGLRALIEPRKYIDARDILCRLVGAGRLHGAGSHLNRRWFADEADALIWDENRPRTDNEKRQAARVACDAVKEQRRLKRLEQLAAARPRHVWTDEQIATLRLVYPTGGTRAAIEKTGQCRLAVRSKVTSLGLQCPQRPPYKPREGAAPVLRERRPRRARRSTGEPQQQRKEGRPGAELIAAAQTGTAVVRVKKVRGPAEMPGEPTYHPDFKFTRCPAPPPPLRTNTHSILL